MSLSAGMSLKLSNNNRTALCIGVLSLFSIAEAIYILYQKKQKKNLVRDQNANKEKKFKKIERVDNITQLIGNTPIIRINSLSKALGCEILGKAEYLNPGGSAKDRVALEIIEMAEKEGKLVPNTDSCVFEGTSGSTGISVCMVAKAKGYKVFIVMPNDVASEKKTILESMGATVEMVRPCSIVESENYVRVAERRALEYNSEDGDGTSKKGYFLDQFENPHNFMAHYKHTGPEILVQTGGKIDAFVHGSGTGGTIAGVTLFLKPRIPHLKVFLADPYGSGNANKVNYGVMFSQTEKEGTRRRYQTDTLVEGVGLNRLTSNFARLFRKGSRSHGCGVNGAYTIDDQATIWMSRYIMENDGLFLGSSSALNLVATVKVAKLLGPGATILTILCDSGQRHLTKFWNNDLLQSKGFDVSIPTSLDVFL